MNKIINSILLACLLSLMACTNSTPMTETQEKNEVELLSKADSIVQASIQAHGAQLFETGHFQFTFRGSSFRFKNSSNSYEYEYRGINKKGDSIHTLLKENEVHVWKNGTTIELNEKQKVSYSDNLNSVIYFATLPYKLGDKSVNKTYAGTTVIKGIAYEVVKVTFDQEGGGTDFDDEYYYWLNAESNLIDYLAYNYQVNEGGVRFRSAYNKRSVGGVIFQDYVNYKAELGTPLSQLPSLFESDSLVEISTIDTEKVTVLTH